MLSVDDAIRGRRSTRRFRSAPVQDDVLREVIDLARHAPSSMNGQPWRFLVVRDREVLTRIAAIKNAHCPPEKRDFPADFVAGVPVLICVAVERDRAHGRGRESGILAAAMLLLAAHARSLSGVFLTAYNDGTLADDLREALTLPPSFDPIAMIPLGYPAEAPPPKALRPLDDLIAQVSSRDHHAESH